MGDHIRGVGTWRQKGLGQVRAAGRIGFGWGEGLLFEQKDACGSGGGTPRKVTPACEVPLVKRHREVALLCPVLCASLFSAPRDSAG